MILSPGGVPFLLPSGVVCHVYHIHYFYFGGKLLLTPGVWLASLFVIAVTGRPLPLVFGIKLAGLFENPTTSDGMIGWFIGGVMNLAGPIQYLD